MIINMNGGGGASWLKLNVFCSTTQPSNPSPWDIWVETSIAANGITMIDDISKCSSTTEGLVVIIYKASNVKTTWNMLKKQSMYAIPLKCYQRLSSKWVSMNAYICYNTWKQFSSVFKAYIAVTWPSGSTCKVTDGTTTLTAPNTTGSYTFTIPNTGTWTVSCTNGSNNASSSVSITTEGQSKSVSLAYNVIPAFTYTGNCKVVNDSGTEISSTLQNNWNIKLLTSGTLTFTDLRGTSSIDVFLVGGGGGSSSKTTSTDYGTVHCGGGGGGYTKTQKGVSVSANAGITVGIGGGGGAGSSGGSSTVAINGSTYSASGGGAGGASWWNGSNTVCGSGGSGGSGGGAASSGGFAGGSGGSDGGNGSGGRSNVFPTGSAGSGQGTTTRAFGESSGELYSYGGSGGGGSVPVVGTLAANTGHGGQGSGGGGYSGIVIIRGHR